MAIFTCGEQSSLRNIFRRATGRNPILKRKKPRVGYFPLPDGKIVSFEEYVQKMGETPDLLEARPPGWDENKEERRVNKRTRNKLYRTITLSSIAFFLFSYGYNQISLMQNYLHESQLFMQIKYMPDYFNTYGHVQLIGKYGCACATAVLAPYLLRIHQDKWILFVTTGAFGIFASLGFLDAKYTIMPSGFVAGFASLPFTITYSMYMVHVAQRLGDLNQKRPYNGIQANWLLYKFNSLSFFAWFFGLSLSSVSCSYLFYGVLERNNTYISHYNLTCGHSQCDKQWPNWWDTMMYERDIPSIDKYAYANIVNASFLIIAMALFLFGCENGQTTKTWSHLKDDKGFELNFKLGFRAIFNWRKTMLAPIFIFTGWSTDFITYTYTRAFHICSFDGWSFYLGIASFGSAAAISATTCPWIARKLTGWNSIMLFSVFCFLSVLLAMLFWVPTTTLYWPGHVKKEPSIYEVVITYFLPSVWGLSTGALYAAINVKIEFEYPDPDDVVSMFSLYHHWRSIGVVIGYATRSTATCTSDKIYALISNLVIGVLFYLLYEKKRLAGDSNSIKADKIELIRFVPNPSPDQMANESDVEEEGTSTSEEEEEIEDGRTMRKRRRQIRYRRKPPPNDPKLGRAWRTPYVPPNLNIPRKYITPDGHILIMPQNEKPPFEVQDAFESNEFRKTDIDRVTTAARKVCFHLGYGGKPLFYNVDELLEDERESYPCKFDARGSVICGRESEPNYYEEDLASNPRHNFPERASSALEDLRKYRHEQRRRSILSRRQEVQEESDNEIEVDETTNLL